MCVVALGSGGTAGGLAAGFAAEGLRTRVVGVCVSTPPWVLRLASLWLARACARRAAASRRRSARCGRACRWTRASSATGYGYPTAEGEEATRVAREHAGLTLDPTYTAKAFACALWHVRARRGEHVLYWHTLSSAPMAPLLAGAPEEDEIDVPSARTCASREHGGHRSRHARSRRLASDCSLCRMRMPSAHRAHAPASNRSRPSGHAARHAPPERPLAEEQAGPIPAADRTAAEVEAREAERREKLRRPYEAPARQAGPPGATVDEVVADMSRDPRRERDD